MLLELRVKLGSATTRNGAHLSVRITPSLLAQLLNTVVQSKKSLGKPLSDDLNEVSALSVTTKPHIVHELGV